MVTTSTSSSVRQRIVDTAFDLFYRQGYRATGVNQVIAASGVAKASFYDHFPSKDDLLYAYVQEMSRRELQELCDSVRAMSTPRQRFFGPLKVLLPWFESSGYRGCPFQNITPELPGDDQRIHQVIREHREQTRCFLRELIDDLIACDEKYAHLRPDVLTDAYLVLFEGVIATAVAYRDTWPVDCAVKTLRTWIEP